LRSQFHKAGIAILLILGTTLAGLSIARLGTTAIVMLYLMAVIATSYFLDFFAAILAAVAAFLAINFFFIEPRYTFEVANLDSWAALLGFLAVSIVVASLVRRLRNQTRQAETARQHAEFARELAERLSGLQEEDKVLDAGCSLIHHALQLPAAIAMPDERGERFTLSHQYPAGVIQLDQRAARWCCQNGKALGPGSGNWPEAPILMMPFGRLPGVFPVLLVAAGSADMEEDNTFLRGLLDQLATAYQRVCNDRRAREAERRAQEESIQSALLASVSHDMRTPLTAILGATTALLNQRSALSEDEQAKLLESVSAEARHLASTTENILSLTRLESGGGRNVVLDWQSPEEIVGAVLRRYRGRRLPHELRSRVPSEMPLIEADAVLLTQALGNLIDNALAAHHGNEPVWVGVASDGNAVTLYVEDRGAGFPENFRVEDIHKFQRLQRHAKGMGLGLSIVQAIAHLHHAALRIDRCAGGGTRVALVFPAQPAAEEA
jgi:two-component system sensor histidine kinase KdpD